MRIERTHHLGSDAQRPRSNSCGGGPNSGPHALPNPARPPPCKLAGGRPGPTGVERKLERRTQSVHAIDLHCNDFNFSQVIYGNVVVRGSKLDFIQESIGDDPNGGFVCDAPSGEKPVLVIEYNWVLTGGQLQITRTSPNLCHWAFTGTTLFNRIAG